MNGQALRHRLGGYRWGLERKRALLDAERAARAAA
jgi:O6-methylguanine-DNA--protein-cysteine methyltransferase